MNTKTLWIVIGVIVVLVLGWWWYSSMTPEAPTPSAPNGEVQGANDTNPYNDNSKDGGVDTGAGASGGVQY